MDLFYNPLNLSGPGQNFVFYFRQGWTQTENFILASGWARIKIFILISGQVVPGLRFLSLFQAEPRLLSCGPSQKISTCVNLLSEPSPYCFLGMALVFEYRKVDIKGNSLHQFLRSIFNSSAVFHPSLTFNNQIFCLNHFILTANSFQNPIKSKI